MLYDNPIAIREVAEALGLQDLPPSPTPSPASAPAVVILDAAEDAAENAENAENAEKERTEKMLRARRPRQHRRMIEELDLKALAKEWGCSEEEARRIVAERLSEAEEEVHRKMIERARSIIEGY